MYPHERSLVKKLADEPFAILGVNSDKDRNELQKILKEKDLSWPSFFDGGGIGGPIATQWGVTGWPTIYVLDVEGVIRFIGLRGARLEEAVLALIAEAKAAKAENDGK